MTQRTFLDYDGLQRFLNNLKTIIPTVNNKTLTIQKNGTTVNTFTANSASDVTANITVPTAVSELTNDSGYLTSSSTLDSSKLTGTIDIARLPKGALERLVTVANQTARFALTTSDVQLGDTVKQLDTGVMYIVTDESKLSSADGYTEYTAGSATSVPWSGVTGKPSSYTPSSHTHGNVTNDGKLPTASRALISDSSKNITVSSISDTELGYLSGVTSSVQTQLNGKAASTHVHGNITNDGKVGTTANKPLITGTGGVVQAGSFGNAANTFCEGNDSRLSDARTPVAHTHLTADVTDLLSDTHTWTSQQSYNSDLNLNYASTDVDDIVNSVAGSATLDNFVHMSGNETVNGIKSFPDGVIANVTGSATSATNDGSGNVISTTYGKLGANNTWTGDNTFRAEFYSRNNDYVFGTIPQTNQIRSRAFIESNGATTGNVLNVIYSSSGITSTSISARNKSDGTTLSTSGNAVESMLQVALDADGTSWVAWAGKVKNNISPYANNTYNLGDSAIQWKSVYARTYYYNGTAWGLDKANIWSGNNTYSKPVVIERNTDTGNFLALKNSVAELGSTPASATPATIAYRDKNDENLGYMGVYYDTDGSNHFRLYVRNKYTSGAPSTSGTVDYVYFGLRLNADKSKEAVFKASLRPYDSTQAYSLGDSNYKWKSLNGVNPGALSLPDSSKSVTVDTTGYADSNDFYWTPSSDGWLSVSIQHCSLASIKTKIGEFYTSQPSGWYRNTVPVAKNKQVTLLFACSSLDVPALTFFPCLGNV